PPPSRRLQIRRNRPRSPRLRRNRAAPSTPENGEASMNVNRFVSGIVLATLIASSTPARADRATDAATAQSLYDEGRQLMEQGKHADACPKLEASQKLDPGPGTQFHLADCYEHIGRTASAWALFLEVAGAAKAHGKTEQEQIARDRAA